MAIYIGTKLLGTNRNHFTMLEGLRKFFESVKNLRHADIAFSRERMQGLKCETIYKDSDIPLEVRKEEPLLLDPVIPPNNRLQEFDAEFFELIALKAEESLEVLRQGELSCTWETRSIFAQKVLCPGPFIGSKFSGSLGEFSHIPLPTKVKLSEIKG